MLQILSVNKHAVYDQCEVSILNFYRRVRVHFM